MPRNVYVVFTEPVEGREDEYNDWYDNTHLGDVVAVPGVTAATRYQLVPLDRPGAPPAQYLAIYELEGDPAVAIANIGAAAKKMHISSAMKTSPRGAYVFREVTPRRGKG